MRWVETETSRFGRRGTTDGADGSRDVDVVGLARACVEDDDDGDVDGWEGEGARVGIRNARKDANDFLKEAKNEGMSEDDLKKGETMVQELTNQYVTQVETVLSAKEADIMTI